MQTTPTQPETSLAKQIIKRQLNRSGNILMSAMEPMSDVDFFDRQINNISIAWTVGHLACVMDLFGGWLSGKGRQFPADVHQVFNSLDIGPKTKEKWELVNPQHFSKADILLLLRRAQINVLQILEDFDLGLWNVMPPDHVPDTLPTYGAIWESLGVHTYWHLGEICGCTQKFHGTYTLNSVLHYYYAPPAAAPARSVSSTSLKPTIEPVAESFVSMMGSRVRAPLSDQEITVFLSL